MSSYPYIYPSIEIMEYNTEVKKLLILQSPEQQIKTRSSGGKKYKINESAVEILFNFDGTKTYEEIVNYFVEKYGNTSQEVDIQIKKLLETITKNYGFEVREQEKPNLHEIKLIQYNNIYPTVVSLELTDRCNIRCKHCYGSFGIENVNEIPKESLQPLLKSLKEVGVLTVEFTGGDPSVYPYTAEAIDIAFEVGIQSVMLLTNGINLSDKLVDTIVRHKERLFVQIDLHSLDEDYFDWFTGSKNALPKVKENIDKLVAKGVQIRVCSIITPKNLHELLDISEWAYEHGAILFAPSPVVKIGRAINDNFNEDLIFTNITELEEFNNLYEVIEERHPNFIRGRAAANKLRSKNCGALISQCGIRANGDIKLCTMDTGEYFNLNIGNILENSMKQVFSENREFLNEFAQLSLPKKDSDECKDCINFLFCDGCLVRGFLRAQDMKEKCNWYQKSVSPIIKDRFPIKVEC